GNPAPDLLQVHRAVIKRTTTSRRIDRMDQCRTTMAQGCPRIGGADHPRRGRRGARARSRRFHQGGYRGLGAPPAARQHADATAVSAYLMLELTANNLARAGDRLDDAFAFLEGLDYAALEFAPGG